MTWVTALVLVTMALPALLARLAAGIRRVLARNWRLWAPLAVAPAITAVIIAAYAAWWLAVLLAVPAVLLVMWQLPPLRRARSQAESWPSGTGSAAATLRLRLFSWELSLRSFVSLVH